MHCNFLICDQYKPGVVIKVACEFAPPHQPNCIAGSYGDAQYVKRAICRAVSLWAGNNDLGRAAVAQTNGDFNIIDLAEWYREPTLRSYLTTAGITDLAIITICAGATPGWNIDERLYDQYLFEKPTE